MDACTIDAQGLAQAWFGAVELGDRRRTKRLVATTQRILNHPGGSLPAKLGDPAALEGLYRLMDCPSVTHQSILTPAVQDTWRKMAESDDTVLVIHDTTVLDFSQRHAIDGLGQVGDGKGRGLYAHNSLAVTAGRRVLGLAWQILHARRDVPATETREQRRVTKDRESRLWKDAVEALPVAPRGRRWVDVADRGADITEYLAFEHHAGRSHVTRSAHNRGVQVALAGGEIAATKLHDHLRGLPAMSSKTRAIRVPAGRGVAARVAWVSVSWACVRIVPPRQRRGDHDADPLAMWTVRVWEADPPARADPIEWLLLTNVAVADQADAWERVDWYTVRWVIEEYHKCLKTGMGVEQMQFTSRRRLDPAIGLLSVLATTLLGWRDAARREDLRDTPATSWSPRLWVTVLSSWRHGEPRLDWSVHEFLYALARLGGHQNRKGDGPPGWLVLWRGWTQLQSMLRGVQAYQQAQRCAET